MAWSKERRAKFQATQALKKLRKNAINAKELGGAVDPNPSSQLATAAPAKTFNQIRITTPRGIYITIEEWL